MAENTYRYIIICNTLFLWARINSRDFRRVALAISISSIWGRRRRTNWREKILSHSFPFLTILITYRIESVPNELVRVIYIYVYRNFWKLWNFYTLQRDATSPLWYKCHLPTSVVTRFWADLVVKSFEFSRSWFDLAIVKMTNFFGDFPKANVGR